MRRTSILERLAAGERLVGDGGWGTMLMERGLEPGHPPESLLLSRCDAVEEVVRLYLEAGAQLITTDSFGASPLSLEKHGLEGRTEEINRLAVETVRQVAGDAAYVSASVGPTGRLLKPFGDSEPAEIRAAFERQIRGLMEGDPDLICVETMTDLTEATIAVQTAKALAPDTPVMATMTFTPTPRGFFTIMGVSLESAAKGLREAGADIIGSNCGNGCEIMVGIAKQLRLQTELPLVIQPNAGLPESRGGVAFYPETPEFMAGKAAELLAAGVAIVGGCCGTTPQHIRALREVVRSSSCLSASGSRTRS